MGNVVFLGVEGSGKTTLAMALARAFAHRAGEGWYLRPSDRGAYTFATLAPEDFALDGFPGQTSSVREMTWKIERDGAETGVISILDYPGEIYRLAFLSPEGESDPDAFRARVAANADELAALKGAIDAASDLYVLFNLQDALNLRGDDSNRSAVWVTNECLTRLKALPSKPHVTLVFTQVDRYQTEDDFLHSFTPAELDLIGHDHPDVDWMMVSVMVPPDSEFGIDAFVRRVTGLSAFGVPDGRPRARNTASGSLARLAAHMDAAAEAAMVDKATTVEKAVTVEESAKDAKSAKDEKKKSETSGFLWLVLIAVAVFGAAYLAVHFLKDSRFPLLRALRVQQPSPATQPPPVQRPQPPPAPKPQPPPPLPPLSAHDELADETSAAIAAARACSSMDDAREMLSYAADGLGSAEALYERARIDDLRGWGAFVRTREDKDRNPSWKEWLRRIDLLGEKKAVVMQRPATNAVACRAQALADYGAAAARGVSAAVDALARHASHENNKEVRRSGAWGK